MAKSKYSRREFLKHNSLTGFGAVVAMGVAPSLFAEDVSSAQTPASLSRKEEIVKTTPQKSRLMSGRTYYIDPVAGDDANNGLTRSLPFKTYAPREFRGGDTVLFRRGRCLLTRSAAIIGSVTTRRVWTCGTRPLSGGSSALMDPLRLQRRERLRELSQWIVQGEARPSFFH